jgi:hypothetical protein
MTFFTRIQKIIRVVWIIGPTTLGVVEALDIFGVQYPRILSFIGLLWFLIVFDIGIWMLLSQVAGNWFHRITKHSKMPDKDNYTCKADYILPFEGRWTAFNGGVTKGLSHSWGIVAQRYAYDFIIMDDNGKSFAGDNKSLQSYFCYGKNILAPADGTVVKVSSKHVDSRVTGEKVYCDTWDMRGNFVVIKHADREYSASAHPIPDSITVRKGDKVTQGQVIGKCGNSGNTSEPHLHFQLQTGKSFFRSVGLPISFVNIKAQEKTNYGMADPRGAQKEVLEARGEARVYIGRGLEVENGSDNSAE